MLKVSDLLQDPKSHTKRHFARNSRNQPVKFNSEKAVKWCIAGAILRCYPPDMRKDVTMRLLKALEYRCNERGWPYTLRAGLVDFNDMPETTHAMVLDVAKLADV